MLAETKTAKEFFTWIQYWTNEYRNGREAKICFFEFDDDSIDEEYCVIDTSRVEMRTGISFWRIVYFWTEYNAWITDESIHISWKLGGPNSCAVKSVICVVNDYPLFVMIRNECFIFMDNELNWIEGFKGEKRRAFYIDINKIELPRIMCKWG